MVKKFNENGAKFSIVAKKTKTIEAKVRIIEKNLLNLPMNMDRTSIVRLYK